MWMIDFFAAEARADSVWDSQWEQETLEIYFLSNLGKINNCITEPLIECIEQYSIKKIQID